MSPRADSLVGPRLQKPQVTLARSTPRQAHSLWSRYPQNCLRPAETDLKLVALGLRTPVVIEGEAVSPVSRTGDAVGGLMRWRYGR
jgi:hypothetical protein